MMNDLIPNVDLPEGRNGPWRVRHFEVSPQLSVESIRQIMQGRGCAPGNYTRLDHDDHGIVMSDTTAEKSDHWEFVQRARGFCVINGLGLGMSLGAVLRKQCVSRVRVIEISEDLIDLVAPHYQDPRVEIVCADALEYMPPKGEKYDVVWHDIWNSICIDDVPEIAKLKRRYGRRAIWQGAWGDYDRKRLQREERDSPWR